MAMAEQPLKKRRVHEAVIDPHGFQQSHVSNFTQDEILRKQRNKAEIRSLFECYRRIKFCVSRKDARLMPDFEQAYLALITASRGCTSTQRILAELIPRYASHCPTALEAAAKVAINMYNWSFALIARGEDSDGIAFQTAQACIVGLVDICSTASSEAPTSSVIRGICSAVFLNVLTFFISSFEGRDIYQISKEDILKMRDSSEFFELKQQIAGGDESPLSRLFKVRVLSLFRIFFCCPRNLLGACFELFKSGSAGVESSGGNYFLRQVTVQIPSGDVSSEGVEISTERVALEDDGTSDEASSTTIHCLMGMAHTKHPSLRCWIVSKYKKLRKSLCSQAVSDISNFFTKIFVSFDELVEEADSQEDSDDDNSDPSKFIARQYMTPKVHGNPNEMSNKDHTSRMHNTSTDDSFQYRKPGILVGPLELDMRSINANSNHDSGGSWPVKDVESGDHRGSYSEQHIRNSDFLSPVSKKPLHLRSDVGEGLSNQTAPDFSSPVMRSTSGGLSNVMVSPEQHSSVRHRSSIQTVWYFDGDSAAMDIFSASKQLWLGSLGPDASEAGVRFQVEKFGPLQQFLFFPIKGFAVVEYINMMDALRAREYMRRSSPWGSQLQVKFLDVGLGSRGSINGVAVGSSCHVYAGNVSSQWMKDDILHEVMRAGFRTVKVSDLTSESALLLEFDKAEEAAAVMAHLRKHRKENGIHTLVNRSLISKEEMSDVSRCHTDGGRHTPITMDLRSSISASMPNSMTGSPRVRTTFDNPIEKSSMRMPQLPSLIFSLSSKYNIPRNYHAILSRDEDRVPTNTLRIGLPQISPAFPTEEEVMTVCSHAVGNIGSVVRATRENTPMSLSWIVELSSVDAARTALKNLRSCPGMFFQIEFSQSGKNLSTPFINRSEGGAHELISPRVNSENPGIMLQSGYTFPMNWAGSGCTQMMEAGSRNYPNTDGPNSNMAVNPLQANHTVPRVGGQMWTYNRPESEPQFSAARSMQCPPMGTQGPPVLLPQQNQASPFMLPTYVGPHHSWDGRTVNHPLPPNPVTPNMMPSNYHASVGVAPPFMPPSVTPIAQISGSGMQHVDQMVIRPPVPSLSPLPPHMRPPLPISPPPLPISQPPLVPPPPSSPPPTQPSVQGSNLGKAEQGVQHQWQGDLCKSGVNYCTIYARREDSDGCKYSNAIPEPVGWPARLDVTKRTDFQHVKSTFSNTPPHKREVCWLLPSTSGDHKGFQGFVAYLQQRECAGVIKIPAGNSMWARLLFILPQTHDICSMLGVASEPSDCLIALVVPKETHSEFA